MQAQATIAFIAEPNDQNEPEDASLQLLAERLQRAGCKLDITSSLGAPTKGAELVVEIAIAVSALRGAARSALPIIELWLNRPRHQGVTVAIDDGEQVKKFTLDASTMGSDQAGDVLKNLQFLLQSHQSEAPLDGGTDKVEPPSSANSGS